MEHNMENDFDLEKLAEKIRLLKEISNEILGGAENFPALNRNCQRVLANIKMLELNVSDINEYC
jgi:hypothetical protein